MTLPVACQITEKVLVMMKAWLEERKSGLNEHSERGEMAITSCHHARLLLHAFLREMILREQAKKAGSK